MEWSRSETLGLAAPSCAYCRGLGLKTTRTGGQPEVCNCVLRAIFRACYARFIECASEDKYMSRACLEVVPGPKSRYIWGRKDEEYVADFTLVTRRCLTSAEYRLFKYHYLLGADWRLCCRKLGMDKGNFFHEVYRIEQKLGRYFRELQPYSLYPLDEYFNGEKKSVTGTSYRVAEVQPIRPPLAGTANLKKAA